MSNKVTLGEQLRELVLGLKQMNSRWMASDIADKLQSNENLSPLRSDA